MTDNESRRHQTFVRVREFFVQHASDFSETGAARQLSTGLTTLITELDVHSAAQAAGTGQARQGTQTRGEARDALREDIEAINRAARAMDLQNQFPLPTGDNDKLLLNSARAFATNAGALQAQFIAHEMPPDFLVDLNADISALETAVAGQGNAVGDRIAAGAAIDDLIDRGTEVVRKLDALIRNKYADNPAVLAEWTSASHTERAPRRAAAAGSTPPPGSSTPPATPGTTPSSGGSSPPAK